METASPDTRRTLLDQARVSFATAGFDGASVRGITQSAGANLGAITYHFGGKEQLYLEVLREVVEPLAARIRAIVAGPGSHLERASWVVGAFFDHFEEFPEMPRLMLQQIATGRPPPNPVMRTMGTALHGLSNLIRDGQKMGDIRPGDPLFMALSVISQPVYMTLVAPILEHATGRSLGDAEEHQALVDHAMAFARAALASRHTGTVPDGPHEDTGRDPGRRP